MYDNHYIINDNRNHDGQGIILIHEHLFNLYPKGKKKENIEFSLNNLEKLNGTGVQYLVDLTPYADVNQYLDIIKRSPIKILCCIGFYCGKLVLNIDKQKSVQELYTDLKSQYVNGISKESLKPSVIKIATNTNIMKPYERRFAMAAIKLSNESGIPIAFHCPFNTFFHYNEMLQMGIDPNRLIICHFEKQYTRMSEDELFFYADKIVCTGSYLQLNDFGTKYRSPKAQSAFRLLKKLLDAGKEDKILLSSDCNWTWKKGEPKFNPGNLNMGYNYLFNYTIPFAQNIGIEEKTITKILTHNTREVLGLL